MIYDEYFTIEQIKLRLEELALWRYRDRFQIDNISFQLAGTKEPSPASDNRWNEITTGFKWEGRDVYAWLKMNIKIPKGWENKDTLGIFDFGNTGDGSNSGFESLLMIDNRSFQGVDQNHKEVFLSDVVNPGENREFLFLLWSGLEGGGPHISQEHKINEASLAWLDPDTDDLYYWYLTAIETIEALNENQTEYNFILNLLERSFLLLDWSEPGSSSFYDSVIKAGNLFKKGIENTDKTNAPTISCIGHAHIDVAWLWRLRHTREKSVRTFSTALRLMDRYPEYVFLQTQPQLYEYLKEDNPEIYGQIKDRVKQGQWEPDGVMWLESDCNLVSGESLVRQMLFGTRFFQHEFGINCSSLWLPDVFGFTGALPQIMKQFGIDTFMTTKISWNQYNRFPNDTFNWRGFDGSEVLAHMITTPMSNNNIYTYNADTDPASLIGVWNAYRQKRLNQNLLVCFGYGDGGGGPTREMIERIKRADKMPGLPKVKFESSKNYFSKLQKTIEESDQKVPVWDGELYLEKHRGTYTSQAKTKLNNRKTELGLRRTEILSVTSVLLQNDWKLYKQEKINELWKIVLRNQFHDIIPGTSIKEVYDDSQLEYESVFRGLSEIQDISLPMLKANSDTYTVFNSGSSESSEIISISSKDNIEAWQDQMNRPLQAVKTGSNWLIFIENIPSMGWITISPTSNNMGKTNPIPTVFNYGNSSLNTPFYLITWNKTGQIEKIYDKENKREVLTKDSYGNELQVFDDRPMHGKDAWGLELYYQGKHNIVDELISSTFSVDGSLRCTVSFKWKYNLSIIEQNIHFYRDSKRIDFETQVDWQETRKLLKVAFPVDIRALDATYDMQFGNIKRPTHWNTSWDLSRFEVCAHQWADLSQRDYGVSLLNDSKYGYDIHDNIMRLSLLKSPIFPDTEGDKGIQKFTYSLLPHKGDWDTGGTIKAAWQLNDPLTVMTGSFSKKSGQVIDLQGSGILIDSIKKAEDSSSIIIRLHESIGGSGKAEITSPFTITSWQEVDMKEIPIADEHFDKIIQLSFRPYEIKTLKIKIEGIE